ncbi:MAG: hypothetical protein HOD63_14745 [Bacteroidetes bacterium]|nr:hypothetical protein [Bacteroidota bacterium]MBT7041327.1 hypothetical protein [Bacteroidota bacterium]MBT7994340.1 hypothetical protein [Bacteroidota bacterium]
MEKLHKQLRKKIRIWIIFFIIALVLSGITAFPIEMQLKLAVKYLTFLPAFLYAWINEVYIGINSTNANFPFLAYGTDWLAFAHIVIAVAFVGPLKDPVKNIWVIQFGMIACVMVIPLALIAGAIRDIPFFWRMIDCSFGVFGIIPLYIVYKYIKKLEHIRC